MNVIEKAVEQERRDRFADEPPTPARRARRRTRARLAAALSIALIGAGGVATATGLIPDDVRRALDISRSNRSNLGIETRAEEAQLRATATASDGATLQLWTAPTAGGGQCSYVRRVSGDGRSPDGPPRPGVGCAEPVAGGPTLELGAGEIEFQIEGSATGSVVFGRVPAATAIVVMTLLDGTQVSGKADRGWFVIGMPFAVAPTGAPKGVPASEGGAASRTLVAVRALSFSGDTLAIVAPEP